ncbi:MAG: TetR/AcrR family transcriptional regulator [Chloroflexota bacterium]
MPRTEEANQLLREAQRAKILEAARMVFARKGMAATMADVAAAAEISQGLAYRYFPSKEAIVTEIIQESTQSGRAALQRILHMPGSPWERLEFLTSRIFSQRPKSAEYYQLFSNYARDEALPDELREALIQQARNFQDVLRQLIVEGQALGEVVAGDPDQLVIVFIAYFDGLSRFAIRDADYLQAHFPDPKLILRILKL